MRNESDKRALSILFDVYWSSAGWKPDADRRTSPDDFAFAKQQGFMFDELTLDHATVMSRLERAVRRLKPEVVGNAFLTSLSSRQLHLRSALGSYAVFRHLAEHAPVGSTRCDWCGFYLEGTRDLNVLNFERHKWGGVRHGDPLYAMLDLELFALEAPATPTDSDVALLKALIAAIEHAPPGTSSANLHKHFPRELKANKAERDVIVGILGYCGALSSSAHPGFAERFVPSTERQLPDRRFVDMAYPACWWTSAEPFEHSALKPYFGQLFGTT